MSSAQNAASFTYRLKMLGPELRTAKPFELTKALAWAHYIVRRFGPSCANDVVARSDVRARPIAVTIGFIGGFSLLVPTEPPVLNR